MYQYTEFDKQFVQTRAAQYRDQLTRNLAGELGDEEFRPLRLQNGWYIQRYAPMWRVAVPYGELNSAQLRVLAKIARDYDTPSADIIAHAKSKQDGRLFLAQLHGYLRQSPFVSGRALSARHTYKPRCTGCQHVDEPRAVLAVIRDWVFFLYKKRLFSIQDIIIYHYISRCYHCVSLCIIVDITIYHVPRRHMISMIAMIHNTRHDIP